MGTAGSPRSRIEEPDATTRRLLPPTARPGRPRWRPAYCGVLIALTLAGCGGTARSVSGGTARSSGVRPSPPSSGRPCQSSQLDLALGQPLSEPTGQHSLSRKLTSTSGSRCFLRGYPRIAFYDHKGSAIPFRLRHAGDQVMTAQPPTQVNLAPGATAYVTINKYRCDAADLDVASVVSLAPPDDPQPLRLRLGGFPVLAYCGPGDPGSRVAVSPVAGSFQETLTPTDAGTCWPPPWRVPASPARPGIPIWAAIGDPGGRVQPERALDGAGGLPDRSRSAAMVAPVDVRTTRNQPCRAGPRYASA